MGDASRRGTTVRSTRELFAKKINEAQTFARDRADEWITIDGATMNDETQIFALDTLGFQPHPTRPGRFRAHADPPVVTHLKANTIKYDLERFESASTTENPAPGRSRQPLVHPRLEHPRQQDPIEHRGGCLRVPQHVRLAECRPACSVRPRPSRHRPYRTKPTRTKPKAASASRRAGGPTTSRPLTSSSRAGASWRSTCPPAPTQRSPAPSASC